MQTSEQINELAAAMAKAQGSFWWHPPETPDYLVSECGEVMSTIGRPRLLKPIRMGNYLGVQLRRPEGGTVKRYVHRLVAAHVHGEGGDGQEVRHLDGDRFNNRHDNLAWGTRAENHADKRRHGTSPQGERNPMARLTRAAVAEMRHARTTGETYRAIGERFGVSTMTAYRAVKEQSWK